MTAAAGFLRPRVLEGQTSPAVHADQEVGNLVRHASWLGVDWLSFGYYPEKSIKEQTAHDSMIKALDKMDDCMEDDWDGEGAKAVHRETLEIAEEVVGLLAGYLGEVPEIHANHRGEIEFSWNVDGRMLLLGVCPGRVIAFASVHGDSRVRGRETWGGDLPVVVPCLLRSLLA